MLLIWTTVNNTILPGKPYQ